MNKELLISEFEEVLAFSEENYLVHNSKFFVHALYENLLPESSRVALACHYMSQQRYSQVCELLEKSSHEREKYMYAVANYRMGNFQKAKKTLLSNMQNYPRVSTKKCDDLKNQHREANFTSSDIKNESLEDFSNNSKHLPSLEHNSSSKKNLFGFGGNLNPDDKTDSHLPHNHKINSNLKSKIPSKRKKNIQCEADTLDFELKNFEEYTEEQVINGASGLYYLGLIFEGEGKLEIAVKCFKNSYNSNPKIFHAFIKFTELNAKLFFSQNSSTVKKINLWLSKSDDLKTTRGKLPKTFYNISADHKNKAYLLQSFEEENLLGKRAADFFSQVQTPGKANKRGKFRTETIDPPNSKTNDQPSVEFEKQSQYNNCNIENFEKPAENLLVDNENINSPDLETSKIFPQWDSKYNLRTPKNSVKTNNEVFQTFSNLRKLESQSSIEGSDNPFLQIQPDISISPFISKKIRENVTKSKGVKTSRSFRPSEDNEIIETIRCLVPNTKSSIKENSCLEQCDHPANLNPDKTSNIDLKSPNKPSKATKRKGDHSKFNNIPLAEFNYNNNIVEIQRENSSFHLFQYLKCFKPGIVSYYMRDFDKLSETFLPETAFDVSLSPLSSSFANVLIGKSYINVMQYEDAEKYFETAYRKNGLSMEGLEYFSSCLWYLKKSARLLELSSFCDKNFPKSSCSHIVRGNCYSLLQDHQNAIENFKKAIKKDGTNSYALCLLGHEYVFIEDFERATKAYSKAIELNSLQFYAFWGLGNIYLKTEKATSAMNYFFRALLLNPMCPLLYTYIGITYLNINKSKEALLYFKKSEHLNPNSLMNSFYKASAWYNEQKWEEAIEELEQLKMKVSNEAKIYILLGKIYKKLGRNDLAHMNFIHALDLDPKDSQGKIRNLIDLLNTEQHESKFSFLLETPKANN
jgi:anaphase-promoting complex subunit 3